MRAQEYNLEFSQRPERKRYQQQWWIDNEHKKAPRIHANHYDQCSHDVNELGWFGTCSHSALTESLNTARSAEDSRKRQRANQKAYRERNSEAIHAYNKEFSSRPERKEYQQQWWLDNPDKKEQYRPRKRARENEKWRREAEQRRNAFAAAYDE